MDLETGIILFCLGVVIIVGVGYALSPPPRYFPSKPSKFTQRLLKTRKKNWWLPSSPDTKFTSPLDHFDIDMLSDADMLLSIYCFL